MTAVDSVALLAAFAAGLILMVLAPLTWRPKRVEPQPEIPEEIYWPALCGVETTQTTVETRLGLASQLASRRDVRATAIRRAALGEEPDHRVRTALETLAPAIGEP